MVSAGDFRKRSHTGNMGVCQIVEFQHVKPKRSCIR